MGKEKIFGANVRIVELGLFSDEDGAEGGGYTLELERFETDHLEGRLGALGYRADELSIDGFRTTVGRKQSSAEAADLLGLVAESDDGNLGASIARIGFPRGFFLTSGQELFAPHASIEDLHLVIGDIGRLLAVRSEGKNGDGVADAAPDDDDERLDLHFLDVLEGHLNLDLVVDMTLPWIGRRRVTHFFRIPIENGTIDYERLEDDVHWLEAAFLTIDLVGENLVLARDLPLVPYAGKALLSWPLEPEDIPVADFHRVHLRNLLRWQVPAAKDGKGKSKLTLHALGMENIELELAATEPARIALPGGALFQFGDDEQPGLEGLAVSGQLRHRADEATEPSALEGAISLIDVTVKDLELGGVTISADRIHLGEVDGVKVEFDGFRPSRVELTLNRIAATNLRIHFGD